MNILDQDRDEVAALIRAATDDIIEHLDTLADEVGGTHLQAVGMEEVAADPVLADASVRAIRSTVAHWVASVRAEPFAPVEAGRDRETVRMARDLVRRGLDDSVLVAYRIGQSAAFQIWTRIVCERTQDVRLVFLVLDQTSASMRDYIERTLQYVSQVMADERRELLRGSHPAKRETVALLLQGAPVASDRASMQLGLSLHKPHTAVVVWAREQTEGADDFTNAVDLVVRSCDAERHVVVLPSTGVAWLWFAGDGPDPRKLERSLRDWPSIAAAIGPTATGVVGFRDSHRGAVAVQRLITRATGQRQVAASGDVRLAALLARDEDDALAFAREVLGDLVTATPEVRDTVRTFVEQLGNHVRTAEVLFAHRNTVVRRLARADELLPRPLRENSVDVAMALQAWAWFGPPSPSVKAKRLM